MGDRKVGKTSFIERFANNKFETEYQKTIGLEYHVKSTYFDDFFTFHLWDISEGPSRTGLPVFKDTDCVFLVYDVSNRETFEHLKLWRDEFYIQENDANVPIFLLGTKSDLAAEAQVKAEEATMWCEQFKRSAQFQISAATGENIEKVFFTTASYFYEVS
uniref:Roc domain-containing protein n=1 Tax=Arcella intermedia TaxID=1963864 RepID=A0A6B2LME8_9EUKA